MDSASERREEQPSFFTLPNCQLGRERAVISLKKRGRGNLDRLNDP